MKMLNILVVAVSLAGIGLSAAPAEARSHKVKVCKIVREHHHNVKRCHWVWRR